MTRDQLLTDAKTLGRSIVTVDGNVCVRRFLILSSGYPVLRDIPNNSLLEKFIKDATEYLDTFHITPVEREELRDRVRMVYQTLSPGASETAQRLKTIKIKYFGITADKQMRNVEHRLITEFLQAIETHAAMTAPYDSKAPLVLNEDAFAAYNAKDVEAEHRIIANSLGIAPEKIARDFRDSRYVLVHDNTVEMLRRDIDILRAGYNTEIAALEATIVKKDEEIATLREDAARRAANLHAAVRRGR